MAKTLEQIRAEIIARQLELRPLVDEYHELAARLKTEEQQEAQRQAWQPPSEAWPSERLDEGNSPEN